MRIQIHNHYHDHLDGKVYEGAPVDIKWALLRDFPWLDYIDARKWNLDKKLKIIFATLNRGQMYSVDIIDGTMADGVLYDQDLLNKAVDPSYTTSALIHGGVGTMPNKVQKTLDSHVDYKDEYHPHKALQDAYQKHVLDSPEVQTPTKGHGGYQAKHIYDNVPTHLSSKTRFMVKPYFERDYTVKYPANSPGWTEMTSQALYHAGGIGDLHQKVHVADHPVKLDDGSISKFPSMVIHMEPHYITHGEWTSENKAPLEDVTEEGHKANGLAAQKIWLMDVLCDQDDRHGGNVMVNTKNGKPLAIDNSLAFSYDDRQEPIYYYRDFHSVLSPLPQKDPMGFNMHYRHEDNANHFKDVFGWWKQASPAIRKEFGLRANLIKDPVVKQKIVRGFLRRAYHLDKIAQEGPNKNNLWKDMD